MEDRISRDVVYMEIAQVISKRSTCLRKKVGVVVTQNNRPVAMGYNGVAAGRPHCDVCIGPQCSKSIHAEAGVISFCARMGIPLEGATMYITLSPCISCANWIINAGIKEVIYDEAYRDMSGVILLKGLGINIRQLGGDSND